MMHSSRNINSPFNEWWIVWLRFIWETQHLLEWHALKIRVTKFWRLRKNHCYTSLHVFLPYLLVNYSISWYILQVNSIPYSMRGELCGYDNFWRYSSLLNEIPPKVKVTKCHVWRATPSCSRVKWESHQILRYVSMK